MFISDFTYYKPSTLNEALKLLSENEDSTLLAGGTDLLVEIKKGVRKVNTLISLNSLSELKGISESEDSIIIYPGTTHNDNIQNEIIRRELPALYEASKTIGSFQIRNTATIGGNLCTAASCADTAPVLMAYKANVELTSYTSSRIISLEDFFQFHHKTQLKKDEILTKIIVPKIKNCGSGYEKFGLRDAASISVASVAIVINFYGEICADINIYIGACAPTPLKAVLTENYMKGLSINNLIYDENLLNEAGLIASKEIKPISDIRASAEYRRELVKILIKNAFKKAITNYKIL